MRDYEYPEDLVEKIADIIVEFAPDNPPGVQQMWSYGIGERILDALEWAVDVHDTSDDTLTVEAAADEIEHRLHTGE
jgi:hypothetical protein